MATKVKSTAKNIILVILAGVCLALVVRLWYGELPLHGLIPVVGGEATGINPWDEASAQLMLSSARLAIYQQGETDFVYNNLQSHMGWQLITDAMRRLIEEGDFVSAAAVQSGTDGLSIQYNFPMPSNFFRESFGRRPGFLSSHFDDFESLRITPTGGGLEFVFTSKSAEDGFLFILEQSPLYSEFTHFLSSHIKQQSTPNIQYVSPIGTLSLSAVNPHISFLFPNPAAISQASINGIFTYSDNRRVARFFPNNVVEFNAIPNPGPLGDFAQSLLVAFDMISGDSIGNGIILSHYEHNADSGRWHFYFDYTLNHKTIPLERAPLEVHVLRRDVVFYRRLMLDFFEEDI